MSKKAARRLKGTERDVVVMLRRNMKEAVTMLKEQQRQLTAYVSFGQDLYMTCNSWLFTEESRTDTTKMARAIELLLLCRKYADRILHAWRSLALIKKSIEENLIDLRKGDVNEVLEKWMGITQDISSIGEQVAEAILVLTPVKDEKLEDIKNTVGEKPMAAFMEAAIKEAQENLEQAREANLKTPVDPEALAAMEAAIAQAETGAMIHEGESVPVMEEGEKADDPVLNTALKAAGKALGFESLDDRVAEIVDEKYQDLNVPESALRDSTDPVDVIERMNQPEGVIQEGYYGEPEVSETPPNLEALPVEPTEFVKQATTAVPVDGGEESSNS